MEERKIDEQYRERDRGRRIKTKRLWFQTPIEENMFPAPFI
jgi:hypothetical protein